MIPFNKTFRLAKQIEGNMIGWLKNVAPVAFAGISIAVSAADAKLLRLP